MSKNQQTSTRPSNLTEHRVKIEQWFMANLKTPATIKKAAEVGGITRSKAANVISSLSQAGLIRPFEKLSKGHTWVWHSSPLRLHADKADNVAGPRIYVNGSMPNGSVSYWKQQMDWGRNA